MRVEALDRSWLLTPFLRHRMVVESPDQIEQLRACGVRTLEVSWEEEPPAAAGPSVSDGGEADKRQALSGEVAPFPNGAEGSVSDTIVEPGEVPPAVPFEEELPAAKQVYRAAKTIVEDAMRDVRMGRAINMDAVHGVVSDMADSVLRNPDALTSLSRLKRFDEYTFYHSVNTALLAISLGRALGFDGGPLHELGVGTLLHDIGKTRIPPEILNKPGRFDPHEYELMKQHVLRGVEVLSEKTGLPETCVKPALEHHERVDGTGYPYRRRKGELSRFGLITAVVDIYDAITSDRCYHKAKPAHEALQFLFLISQRGHLDHEIVQRFIQVVGVYPVGSVVELNTGEVAIVRRVHHAAPLRPSLLIIKGPGNTLLPHPLDVDLRQETAPPHRTVATAKDPLACGIDPSLYLDKESL